MATSCPDATRAMRVGGRLWRSVSGAAVRAVMFPQPAVIKTAAKTMKDLLFISVSSCAFALSAYLSHSTSRRTSSPGRLQQPIVLITRRGLHTNRTGKILWARCTTRAAFAAPAAGDENVRVCDLSFPELAFG